MSERPIIGVIGLGTMGLGIAQVYAQAGFPVIATDAMAAARHSARQRLADALALRVAAGKLGAEARDGILANLSIGESPRDMGAARLVIEAIVERIEAKTALFAELEAVIAADAMLATNTSSLSVATIAKGLAHPSRVLGLHFFNPAPAMKLVELVAHRGTDHTSLAVVRSLTEDAGKTVIGCPDRPGFIVNRCARPFYGEALALLEEGRTASGIDAAMVAAGYRLGPFSLIDLIGADINLAATEGLARGMDGHPRYHVFQALRDQVARGDLGRKTGRGFIFPDSPAAPPADWQAIALRIDATLANEAASLLEEGGVDERSIDIAIKLGLNFPRGPFESARTHRLAQIRETLRILETKAPPHLKGRYVISSALVQLR